MQSKLNISATIELQLNLEEATFLCDVTRNPISDSETQQQTDIRIALFESIAANLQLLANARMKLI